MPRRAERLWQFACYDKFARNRGKKYAIAWAKSCGDASQCDPITGVEFRFIAQICVVHTDGKNEKSQQIIPVESKCKRESGWRCRKKKEKKQNKFCLFTYSRRMNVRWYLSHIYARNVCSSTASFLIDASSMADDAYGRWHDTVPRKRDASILEPIGEAAKVCIKCHLFIL